VWWSETRRTLGRRPINVESIQVRSRGRPPTRKRMVTDLHVRTSTVRHQDPRTACRQAHVNTMHTYGFDFDSGGDEEKGGY